MKTVRVRYHQEPDGWWAESTDVEGWTAAGATFEAVQELAREGLSEILGEEVYVESETDSTIFENGVLEGTGTVYPQVSSDLVISRISIVPAPQRAPIQGISEARIVFDEEFAASIDDARLAGA